ncbi:MAG: PilZ domain-containing protein [Bdellovibrionota bacterium]
MADVYHFIHVVDKNLKISILGIKSAHCFIQTLNQTELSLWNVSSDESGTTLLAKDWLAQNEAVIAVCAHAEAEAHELNFGQYEEVAPIKILHEATRSEGGESEKRQHKRLRVRLNVKIINEKKKFEACTRDISLGGLMLENPIPQDFLFQKNKIVVSTTDNSFHFEFEAKILESSTRGTRIMFDNISPMHMKNLQGWLCEQDESFKEELKKAS